LGTSRVLWHDEKMNRYDILDGQTGEVQCSLHSDLHAHPREPEISKNGRVIAMAGSWQQADRKSFWAPWLAKVWPQRFGANQAGVLVGETTTGRELLRLHINQVARAQLSDDGETLVTTLTENRNALRSTNLGLQVWDVYPHRAYFWA